MGRKTDRHAQSQISEVSTAALSTISVPTVFSVSRNYGLGAPSMDRVLEKCRLKPKPAFQEGRARRIAQCYRELLVDIRHEPTGLQDWCRTHTTQAPPISLAKRSLSRSSRIASEATLVSSLSRDTFKCSSEAVAGDKRDIKVTHRTDSSFMEAEDPKKVFLEIAQHDVSPPMHNEPQSDVAVAHQERALIRLSTLFPQCGRNTLLSTLGRCGGNEFSAITVLMRNTPDEIPDDTTQVTSITTTQPRIKAKRRFLKLRIGKWLKNLAQ